MTPPVREVMMEGWEGGAGPAEAAGGGGTGGGGRGSSFRGFLGRPRFRFTGEALAVATPKAPPTVTTSRGRLLVPPRAFWTTEVGAEGAC